MDILNDYISTKISEQSVTNCLLCNEDIIISSYHTHHTHPQICGRCKNAWLKIRDAIEEKIKGIDKEEKIQKILDKLEQTPDGKIIAKGYKDFCLNKNDKN